MNCNDINFLYVCKNGFHCIDGTPFFLRETITCIILSHINYSYIFDLLDPFAK